MARRRIVGSVIVNPKPKRSSSRKTRRAKTRRRSTRRTTSSRRKTSTRKRAASPTRRRRTTRKNPARRPIRRRLGVPRRVRRRRIAASRPAPRRRRALAPKRRAPMRRRFAPKRAIVRRRIRQNPGMVKGLQNTLRKIPFVGRFVANLVGFAPHSLLGAISVEPVSMLARFAAQWLPDFNASLFYALTGGIVAAAVGYLPIPTQLRGKLQVAIAAGSGAVAWHMYRNPGINSGAMEAETLEDSAAASSEGGLSGLLGLGDPGVTVGDISVGDVFYSGVDMTMGEVEAALSGPRAWRRLRNGGRRIPMQVRPQRGMPAPGPQAEQEGARLDWVAAIWGFPFLKKIAQLPPQQRQRALVDAKQAAIQSLQGSGGNMGSVLYATN